MNAAVKHRSASFRQNALEIETGRAGGATFEGSIMTNGIKKGVLGAAAIAAAATALAVAAPASAQTYCNNNAGTGALIGGAAGAVAGSQLSARGRHTENSLLGAVGGALIGGAIGRGSSNCSTYVEQPAYSRYDDPYYGRPAYQPAPAYVPAPAYGYYAPPPVYVEPAPVYVAPAPRYYYRPHYRGYYRYGY
jgi:hypothetical protein